MFVPYFVPDIGQVEHENVLRVLKSGWLTTGKITAEFEKNFSSFLGAGDTLTCLAVNSATSGLHLCLEALGISSGDEVITTTHTFTATAEVIRYLGATPVLVDVDPVTLCISPTAIEAAITSRTKAVIPVHFAGISCDMNAIISIARQYKLKIVEDAAHAFPATYNQKLIGTLDTDATVFSFYANKTITTGEGGMVVTRNTDIANRVKVMRLHGINSDAFNRFTDSKPSWFYDVIAPGFKYNMTYLAAAVGLGQLEDAIFRNQREKIASFYDSHLNSDL